MIAQLEAATARIEAANLALDELIFALNARLTACRKARAQRREREKRERQRNIDAPVPNLWWVGGRIILDILPGGALGSGAFDPDPNALGNAKRKGGGG